MRIIRRGKARTPRNALVPNIMVDGIERRIFVIRGRRVMLDSDLATLYGVPTKSLNLAVRRNRKRFPHDFMFQLTREEPANLRFQSETSRLHGGRRYFPYVFTREGIAMLSSVIRSDRAVMMNVAIMRAFVKMGDMLYGQKALAQRLDTLLRKFQTHDSKIKRHDREIRIVLAALHQLMNPPASPRKKIGF